MANAEARRASEVKPILKKASIVDAGEVAGRRVSKNRGHMKWDEDNLRENAEYMAANPKMKIDEPDTPYNPYNMAEDAELNEALAHEHEAHTAVEKGNTDARMLMLSSRLTALAEQQEADGGSASASASAGDAPPAQPSTPPSKDAADHDAEFKMKRKAVYADEGAKFRALLKAGIPDSDEDEDDDDDDDGNASEEGDTPMHPSA